MASRPRFAAKLRACINRTYLPVFVAFAVILMAILFAERQNSIIHRQNVRAEVQGKAGMIKSHLEGHLNASIQLVRGLVAVLSTEPDMDQQRFEQLAEQVIGPQGEIRHVAAAPDLVISLVYPMAGNEKAVGLDYNQNEAQRAAAYRVRDSGDMVLAGPVNLVQGGRGFIGRFPIFTGSGADRRFWGILSAVIDVDTLYAETGITSADPVLDLALAGQDGTGAGGGVFFGDASLFADDPVLLDIALPVGGWQLAARPAGGWPARPDNLWELRIALLSAGFLILFPIFLAARLSAARKSVIQILKRREGELEKLSRRLEIAVETSNIGIWETDRENGQMIWDRRMRDLYGIKGNSRHLPPGDWIDRLHPEDAERATREFYDALQGGSRYVSEYRILPTGGSEKHIRSFGSPYTDAAGVRRMIGVDWDASQDVQLREELMQANRALTERNAELHEGTLALERAHAELQEQQAELHRLSLVAKHASDSIIVTDAETRILWVNDAFTRVTGYTAAEAVGKMPADFLNGPKTDPRVLAEMGRRKQQGVPFHTEILNYTKSGKEIWIDTNLVPVLCDDGKVDLIIGIERDITGAKAREAELAEAKVAAEQADRAKSEFLANMSHEIRTPMNGIIGMADLLAEAGLPEEEEQFVNTIRSSSHALLQIINDILDLSRLEAGKLSIVPVDFDLRHCIGSAVDLLRPKAREKGLELSFDYAGGLPERMRGDEGRLRQILVNLLGNAVKFTSDGSVRVRAGFDAGTPDRLLIEVEDTGIGISKEHSEHIFDRFSQADAAVTRPFGGTGLGLTISCILSRLMGGGITLESELGKGSCFRLSLPLEPARSATAPDAPADQPVPLEAADFSILSGSRILLAEDNRTNRLLVRKYLAAQPVELVEAVNGREAVETAAAGRIDIVLMDMSMPELDGISATREIRALDIPQPAIVALTANAFDSDRQACLAAGMDGFLQKPIGKLLLLKTLAAVLAERRETSPDPAAAARKQAG